MCGIAALVSSPNTPLPPNWPFWGQCVVADTGEAEISVPSLQSLLPPLERRGPDDTVEHHINICEDVSIQAASTLLSLRGPRCLKKEIKGMKEKQTQTETETQTSIKSYNDDDDETGRKNNSIILLFNGEIYATCGDEHAVPLGTCDTSYLQNMIENIIFDNKNNNEENEDEDEGEKLRHALDKLRGPWAIIFWSSKTRRLYFGKDMVGRRSLLLHVVPNSHIILTSVPPHNLRQTFAEIPPIGLAFIDFSDPSSPKFDVASRPCHPVAPPRLAGRSRAIVAGSTEDMYVSFLPCKWLRCAVIQGNNGDGSNVYDFNVHDAVVGFVDVLRQAVRRRLVVNSFSTSMSMLSGKINSDEDENDIAKYALLFSGGIDSMVLARLLDEEMPRNMPLMLINVAFGDDHTAISECPDRVTAESGVLELRSISTSGRNIQLISVNVNTSQAKSALDQRVRALVHPCAQPMDATIGTALWMAAGVQQPDDIRILFSGLGADELMAGYKGRHRTVFRTEGPNSVAREMDADLSRLWFRNLGRDDRIVSDHSRELRHPFLDEDVIEYITGLPLTPHVCDLSLPDGVGDKKLLRMAAKEILGLSEDTTTRAKRAIQFGSRSKQVIERKMK